MSHIGMKVAVMAALTAVSYSYVSAQEKSGDRKDDEAAIRRTMKEFTTAFEKGDARAAAGFLTSGAELIRDDAPTLRGRDAIEKAFAEHFKSNPRVKFAIEIESIRFTSRDTAIEEGAMRVVPEKGDAGSNRYSVLFVREDGKWLLAFIKEWPHEMAAINDLEWLIGTWSTRTKDAEVKTTYEWFGKKSFIRAQFTLREMDKEVSGMQMIGIDPNTGTLRTWTFEVDGGFGEGTVVRDGNKWVFETSTIMSDGGVLEATNILVQVNKDTFTWQPLNLMVDGEEFGNLPPTKVTRVKSTK